MKIAIPEFQLPSNIQNGVARLWDIGICHEPSGRSSLARFYAVGAIISPESVIGCPISQVIQLIQLDTFTITIEEQIQKVVHEVKKLGSEVDYPEYTLEHAIETVKHSQPLFGFRTFQSIGADGIRRVLSVWTGVHKRG